MKKRFFGVLLVFCLVITLLPSMALAEPVDQLSVGGADVTPETDNTTYYWKTADDGYSQERASSSDYDFSVAYDDSSESFTLTLNGLDITEAYHDNSENSCSGIYASKDLNIVLKGGSFNHVTAAVYAADSFNFNNVFAVNTKGSLNISGKGWLSLEANGGTGGTAAGIRSQDDITVSGGTIAAAAYSASENYGFLADNFVTISGGAVYASGGSGALHSNAGGSCVSPEPSERNDQHVVIMSEQDGGAYTPTLLLSYGSTILPDFDENPGLWTGGFPFSYSISSGGDWTDTQPDTVYGDFDATDNHDCSWSVKYNTAETPDSTNDDALDLTLSSLAVTNFESRGIDANCALNLTLAGENSIQAEEIGIRCQDDLRITGTGELDILANREGILSKGSLRIDRGRLHVRATENGMSSEDGDIIISGSNCFS